MKKTLITLLALAGVAAAAETPVTLGSYYTSNGVNYSTVDNFYGLTNNEIYKLLTGTEGTTDYVNRYSGVTKTLTINTEDLCQFSGDAKEGDTLKLTTFLMSTEDKGDFIGANRYAQVTIGQNDYTFKAYQSADQSGSKVGTFTFDFTDANVTFRLGDTITFTFASDTEGEHSTLPVFQGITGPVVDNNSAGWESSVKINAVTIPEPTTATLSLLALAGLAARRRRR
ncbi:MAG: PEP-CTERM sorting domain-containing protein [Akkermansiaceae bacterium]|nr:PEP-CTERM sorting domain-containing protein [Akkermansiaceae bacterium]